MHQDSDLLWSLDNRSFGGYTLHNQIGQGGMAKVYLAQRTRDLEQLHQNDPHYPLPHTSQWFALKMMHPHLAKHQQTSKQNLTNL